ncbi:MAG: DUF2721 domain-containing protein [Chitinophagales bacterium]
MEVTLTTPAILFPAVSLLLIAYTNRYLAIARLIRELKIAHRKQENPIYLKQIRVLKRRERFIRNMQVFAIASLFFCTFSMALIFLGQIHAGMFSFGVALVLMLISLSISFRDTLMAGSALKIELDELEEELRG